MQQSNATFFYLKQIINKQHTFFNHNQTKDIAFRKNMLCRLKKAIRKNEKNIFKALHHDLGKSKAEAYMSDIAMVYQDALSSLNPSMLISAQMKQRQIRRTYLALTDGIPPERGTISAPVARMDASVITREVNFERGEAAVTHYERLAVSDGYALVELHLDTGRTHQIRVHMKYIGCPLPGDFLYHPVFDRIGRQALHSFQLEFAHPITGEPMCFLAPVPEDFRRAFLQ